MKKNKFKIGDLVYWNHPNDVYYPIRHNDVGMVTRIRDQYARYHIVWLFDFDGWTNEETLKKWKDLSKGNPNMWNITRIKKEFLRLKTFI
tara:strand:- start:2798 stop:3067 length:270 start_codon:yes stop_codon:yes gene_type:complete